jgi:hypothetical protein
VIEFKRMILLHIAYFLLRSITLFRYLYFNIKFSNKLLHKKIGLLYILHIYVKDNSPPMKNKVEVAAVYNLLCISKWGMFQTCTFRSYDSFNYSGLLSELCLVHKGPPVVNSYNLSE